MANVAIVEFVLAEKVPPVMDPRIKATFPTQYASSVIPDVIDDARAFAS